MSLEDAFNFRGLIRPPTLSSETTATALPGSLQAPPYQNIQENQRLQRDYQGQGRGAEQLLLSSSFPSLPDTRQAYVSDSPIELNVGLGSDAFLSPPDTRPPVSPLPIEPGLDEAARNSCAAVLRPSYFRGNPHMAAKTLLDLLEVKVSSSRSAGGYHTRSMSLNNRKDLIADLRAADSNAFWGALLDEVRGRQMLASWLRSTVDYPEWAPTRLPLLRLLSAMPVASAHLVDDQTTNCLIKAVNFVVKNAPQKSKELAAELKEDWKHMVITGGEIGQQPSGSTKRFAVDHPDPLLNKKPKPANASTGTSGSFYAPAPMQTMNNLAQTSAYLTVVNHLAEPSTPVPSSATSSKLAATTGTQRTGDLQGIAKKTVTRIEGDLKPACTKCKTVMIPGVTSSTRVKASGPHGQRIDQICLKCKEKVKRVPAPPSTNKMTRHPAIDDDDESDGHKNTSIIRKLPTVSTTASSTLLKRPPTAKRTNAAKDMFSDLLKGPPVTKAKAAQSAHTMKAETDATVRQGKPKKKVRWRNDNLVEVRLFESVIDVDDEVHASIEGRGLHGLESDEGSVFKKAAHAHNLEEEFDWHEPQGVTLPDPSPARGSESEEAKRLEARERSVLSAVYVEVSDIPPSAGEPYEVRVTDPAYVVQQIALPEDWRHSIPSSGSIDVHQLMRQIAGGSVTSAADVPATSLESLGISSDGLQQLLLSSSGGAAPMAPPPSLYSTGYLGQGQGAARRGPSNNARQSAPTEQKHYHQQAGSYSYDAQTSSAYGHPGQHPGPPPIPPSELQQKTSYQAGFQTAATGDTSKRGKAGGGISGGQSGKNGWHDG